MQEYQELEHHSWPQEAYSLVRFHGSVLSLLKAQSRAQRKMWSAQVADSHRLDGGGGASDSMASKDVKVPGSPLHIGSQLWKMGRTSTTQVITRRKANRIPQRKGRLVRDKDRRKFSECLPALASGDIPKETDRILHIATIHTYFGFFVRHPYWEKKVLPVNIKLTLWKNELWSQIGQQRLKSTLLSLLAA